MKIKIAKDLYVELYTLVRVEWTKFYPVLVVHERFEKWVKWILRSLAFIGIATSVITIEQWYNSLILSIIIFLVEQFFERAIFEYTTLVIQPFPDFEIDYGQWKTNGFLLARNNTDLSYIGPAYEDADYAKKFFSYIKMWNSNMDEDKDNNVIISFVIEPNEKYTTYIYPNTETKKIDKFFKKAAKKNALKKYGKRQQQFVAQMIFWHTLPFRDGSFIKTFLQMYRPQDSFYFIAHTVQSNNIPMESFTDSYILKHGYKLKRREELTSEDIEFHFLAADQQNN